jgi:poly(A) polymerase
MVPSYDQIPLNATLQRVALAVKGTFWDGDVYLVGGAVRDALLGRPESDDFDLVTSGNAIELANHLHAVGLALHVPAVYAQFGTARVTLPDATLELITARKESYRGESRKPTATAATYLEDALRRDFTVNTLRADLRDGTVVDTLGSAREDLRARVLRTPKDARATFSEDPLRMLRAVRFRHKLEFEYGEGVSESIRESASRLSVISAERVRDELNKMLIGPHPDLAFADLMRSQLLHHWIPEFEAMVGVEQGSFHFLDVWNHTLLVLKNLPTSASLNLRWAALLHDVAKPVTRTLDGDGRVRFLDHETVGAEMARDILSRLRFSERDTDEISAWVRGHMRIGSAQIFTPTAARRLVRDFGDQTLPLLDLVEADASALRPGVRVVDIQAVRSLVRSTLEITPKESLQSPLSGAEIMGVTGLGPGKQVGQIKAQLSIAVVNGEIPPGDKAAAIAFLARLSMMISDLDT